MRSELKNIELIENYLLGNLNNDQKKAFEFELENDSILKEEVDTQKKLMLGLSLLAFTNEVQAYHPEFIAKEGSGGKFKWFLNSIIVLVISGVTALAIFFSNGNKDDKTNSREKSKNHSQLVDKNNNQNTLLALNDSNSQANYSNVMNGSNSIKIGNNQLDSPKKNNTKNTAIVNKKATVIEPGEFIDKNDSLANDSSLIEGNKKSNDLFDRLQIPFEEVNIQAHLGGNFVTKKSKSKFTIAPGILQHKNGQPVSGLVTIKYREFRDASEMAFSKIPMTHEENGQEYNFNSAGMFEIRAYQNGKELEIAPEKTITVDFMVTEKLDSCYFWSLNDKSQKWEKLDTIKYNENKNNVANFQNDNRIRYKRNWLWHFGGRRYGNLTGSIKDATKNSEQNLDDSYFISKRFLFFFYSNIKNSPTYSDTGYVFNYLRRGTYKAEIKDHSYSDMLVKKVKIKKNKVTKLDMIVDLKKNKNKPTFYTKSELRITDEKVPQQLNNFGMDTTTFEGFTSEQYFDAGHTTPKLVEGLQCPKFGTYNCDAVGILKAPARVRATYSNDLGEEIKPKPKAVLSLVDLKQNAAFSFDPKNFTCSANGRNVILLFNEDKIYAVPEEEFKKMNVNQSGNYNFQVKDITEEVKSSNDLKKYLGL